jgi:hypothetical protein
MARRNIIAGLTPRARGCFTSPCGIAVTTSSIARDAHHRVFDAGEADLARAIDEKRRGNRDAAFFSSVQHAPFYNGRASAVRQQREWNREVVAQARRAVRRIDGDRDDLGAGGAEVIVTFCIVRQLAEAERSPMSTIEQHDAQRIARQLGESPRRAGAIGQREIGSGVADGELARVVHQ